ncbi:MAG: hypothetical protein ACR2LK_01500, partial [Solirubrobacteraceae bacterium]
LGAFVPVALALPETHGPGADTAVRTARLMRDAGAADAFIVLADDNGSVPAREAHAGRIEPSHALTDRHWQTFAAGAERVARAVRDAYAALGEVDTRHEVAWQQRAGGYVRCLLPAATPQENALFAAALSEAVDPASDHRYVLSRPLGRVPYARAWHPVPSDLGRNRERADAYRTAFTRWLGPGELRYAPRDEDGTAALAAAAAAAATYETQTRVLWV